MSRQVASSVHEPDLGKVHRGESLIRGTPFHGRRQPERQLDGHLGKPVNTRLREDGGDDAADRGRSALDVVVVRENGFHRLVGPQARGKVDRLALVGSVLAHAVLLRDRRRSSLAGLSQPCAPGLREKVPVPPVVKPCKASAPVILSAVEAEQLRDRLVLVIDQAMTPARPDRNPGTRDPFPAHSPRRTPIAELLSR